MAIALKAPVGELILLQGSVRFSLFSINCLLPFPMFSSLWYNNISEYIYIYIYIYIDTNRYQQCNKSAQYNCRAKYILLLWSNKTNTSKQLLVSCLHNHQAYIL